MAIADSLAFILYIFLLPMVAIDLNDNYSY